MEKDKKTILAMIITVLILIAVFSGFWLTMFLRETPKVVLPTADPGATETLPGDGTQGEGGDLTVAVTPDTVQSVVATLARPDSYYREITVETFWGEGSSAVSTAQVWVDGGYTRVASLLPDGTVENTIVGEGMRYRWYNNEHAYFSTNAENADADLMQRIPTYEDILALDPEEITSVGYEAKGGLACVYVEVAENELGYRERYWVSVEKGLLVSSETVKEGKVVLRVSAYSVEIPIRQGLSFTLPDGTVLHTPTVS